MGQVPPPPPPNPRYVPVSQPQTPAWIWWSAFWIFFNITTILILLISIFL